ncbi:MAG: bile acid:sodium symporter [Myxococcota bacterium]
MEIGWIDIALGGAMFVMMFAMGLSLSTGDFDRIRSNPRTTIVGTAVQLVIMPVVGMVLAAILELPPLLSTGLVIVAACPGGLFSNMYIHFAGGNTALSITLTATATMATLFTLPLWVQYALMTFSPGGVTTVEMPVLDTALRLSMLTIFPVGVGMFARSRFPALTRFERGLSASAAIVIVAGAVTQGASRPDIPLEVFLEAAGAAAWFALAAIVVGIAVPALFRIPARDTVTIAVEMIVKNTMLGIVLVSQAMDFEALIPIFAFALFQTPGGLFLLITWRKLKKAGYFKEDPSEGDEEVA